MLGNIQGRLVSLFLFHILIIPWKVPITRSKINSSPRDFRIITFPLRHLKMVKITPYQVSCTFCKQNGEVMSATATNGRSSGQKWGCAQSRFVPCRVHHVAPPGTYCPARRGTEIVWKRQTWPLAPHQDARVCPSHGAVRPCLPFLGLLWTPDTPSYEVETIDAHAHPSSALQTCDNSVADSFIFSKRRFTEQQRREQRQLSAEWRYIFPTADQKLLSILSRLALTSRDPNTQWTGPNRQT